MATWAEIRIHYDRTLRELRRSRRLTQQQVADAGGLKGQNAISKLLANRNELGPSVGTLVGAVLGLGISLSDFFVSLERNEPHARNGRTPTYQQLSDSDLHALEIGRYVQRVMGELRPRTRPRAVEVAPKRRG